MSFFGRASRGSRVVAAATLVAFASLAMPSVALADPPKAVSADAAAQAKAHFAHARDLYQQGAYREAIGELETAFSLDPNGKDLVFNLGVVHEKLGDIDDALKYFHRYEQMDLDAQERAKADAYLKRLEGARREVEKPPEPTPTPQPTPAPPPPPPPEHGRVDALTLTAAGLALVGFGVGIGFGLRSLSERPQSGTVTSSTNTYQDLQAKADRAHHAAIVSDVGFATGIVATGFAAYLYFGRTRPSSDGGKTGNPGSPVVLYGTAIPRGGAFVLGAQF